MLLTAGASREKSMTSQSFAGVLGALVAAAVLVVAFVYGPLGQFGKPARPAAVQQQDVQPAPVAPARRGPVIREVPN
jgi:hypothetical protein